MRKQSLKLIGYSLITISIFALTARYFTNLFFSYYADEFLIPSEANFAPNETAFSFGVISDTGAADEPFEHSLKRMRKSGVKFVIHLGDLVKYKNPEHFSWMTVEIKEALKKVPFYITPGNHDIENEDGEVDKSSYIEVFGHPDYWFSYGNALFISLDSSVGKISNKQIVWLNKILNEVRPKFKYCILYTHTPPRLSKDDIYKKLDAASTEKLANAIQDKGVDLLLNGHVHYFSDGKFAGVPFKTLVSSGQELRDDAKQYGYLIVDISPDNGLILSEIYVEKTKAFEEFEYFISHTLATKEAAFMFLVLLLIGLNMVSYSKPLTSKQK